MLGAAIQNGLDQQNATDKGDKVGESSTGGAQKRKLEEDAKQAEGELKQEEENSEISEPSAKKMRVETIQ